MKEKVGAITNDNIFRGVGCILGIPVIYLKMANVGRNML
jgi:hypothetical protein